MDKICVHMISIIENARDADVNNNNNNKHDGNSTNRNKQTTIPTIVTNNSIGNTLTNVKLILQ